MASAEAFRAVCCEALRADPRIPVEALMDEPSARGLAPSTMALVLEDERARELARAPSSASCALRRSAGSSGGSGLVEVKRETEAPMRKLKMFSDDAGVAPPWSELSGSSTPVCPPVVASRSPTSEARHARSQVARDSIVAGIDHRMATTMAMDEDPGIAMPSVFSLSGFRNSELNATYTAHPSIDIDGQMTYWDRNMQYFMYYQHSGGRWVLTPRFDDDIDVLMEVQQGDTRGVAFEGVGDTWQEFFGDEWVAVSIRRTPLAAKVATKSRPVPAPAAACAPHQPVAQQAVDTVLMAGFRSPGLNGRFCIDTTVQIGGRSTYWDPGKQYFMYYQASERRWAVSFHDDAAWRASRGTGEDPLSDAQRGGTRGLACEAQKGGATWHEFVGGQWHRTAPHVQKLTLGSRAVPLEPLPPPPPPPAPPLPTPSHLGAASLPSPQPSRPAPVAEPLSREPSVHPAIGSTKLPAAPLSFADAAGQSRTPGFSADPQTPAAVADQVPRSLGPGHRAEQGSAAGSDGRHPVQATSAVAEVAAHAGAGRSLGGGSASAAAQPASDLFGAGGLSGAATPVLPAPSHPAAESDDDSSSSEASDVAATAASDASVDPGAPSPATMRLPPPPSSAAPQVTGGDATRAQAASTNAPPLAAPTASKPETDSSSESSSEALRRRKRMKKERKRRRAEAMEARIRAQLMKEFGSKAASTRSGAHQRSRGCAADDGEKEVQERKGRRGGSQKFEGSAPAAEKKRRAVAFEAADAEGRRQPLGDGARRRPRWRIDVVLGWRTRPASAGAGRERCG